MGLPFLVEAVFDLLRFVGCDEFGHESYSSGEGRRLNLPFSLSTET